MASSDSYDKFFKDSLLWRSLIGILFYFVMISLYYLIIYYQNFHQKLMRESELKSLIKEAELKTLKFQINPHFIFNSLNSINALIHSSPEKAGKMTVMLGDFLRSTLSKNEEPMIYLSEELRRARLYLNIEKVRFGEKINYVEEVDHSCMDIKVPTMILQPLFENAVKHGVYESIEPVTIKLICNKQNDFVTLILENDFDSNAVTKKGEGIGLENIRARMQKVYNQNNLFVAEKESGVFKAILYIPVFNKK
jgi:LytS/YehU family sensor histidine kinase